MQKSDRIQNCQSFSHLFVIIVDGGLMQTYIKGITSSGQKLKATKERIHTCYDQGLYAQLNTVAREKPLQVE